ncbi:ribosomal-protein-alanine N-acetyltransferase [Pullulanibacillus pueri]|uniref:N-acetyltransferase n=1 Tax=Pullulanibacillus pueri TaxID=1437324 RepID=A0A8J2ZY60_9BACL|nr:GNAT family protein [Pullulanibacillus pueri]MBM7681001.1 ribosomal-protein-alanine N-acetyltransferase [Pullulanibacillus pueri]GGH86263.1 N-acetyltransferase [Pullulanibacillus pueri]
MSFPSFETERLYLREITEQDAEDFYHVMSLDEVTHYYGMDSLSSKGQAEQIIASFKSTYARQIGMRWAIILKESQTFIGTIGYNNLSQWNKRSEVGYELHPHYWNKGYTSEALNTLIEYAFDGLGLFRLAAVTFPENAASVHLLINQGFKKEGVLRGYIFQNNQSHDALLFSLLRPEWQKERSLQWTISQN